MTTKTKHRRAADKVVIEDDRRVKESRWTRRDRDNPRTYTHDYTQKLKIVSFPVEPQPLPEMKPANDGNFPPLRWSDGKRSMYILHPHPDDTLILLEEWVSKDSEIIEEGYLVKDTLMSNMTAFNHDKGRMISLRELISSMVNPPVEPASTMPPVLDSECQQHNVVKVLGVEENVIGNKPVEFPIAEWIKKNKIWIWKLLTREQ